MPPTVLLAADQSAADRLCRCFNHRFPTARLFPKAVLQRQEHGRTGFDASVDVTGRSTEHPFARVGGATEGTNTWTANAAVVVKVTAHFCEAQPPREPDSWVRRCDASAGFVKQEAAGACPAPTRKALLDGEDDVSAR